MNWGYPPEAEAFRAEVRDWLEHNLAEDLRGKVLTDADDPNVFPRLREWNRVLADAGYAAIAWPVEFGGRGAGLLEQVVLAEELSRVDAPPSLNPIGISNIAPAIMQFGTDEQKHTHLRRMLRADDIWCQGFSEPDAGSDLASLRTTAVDDGDCFVVNGQKIWTTIAHLANWCELLVRSDPDAPKHKGISCLLLDMTLPGVEVRPLTTMTGDADFNEIFLTDVRIPKSALLGPLHEGWKVAMSTLTHERAGVATLHLTVRKKVARLLDAARERGVSQDPVIRQKLARVYVEAEYLKLLADRAVSGALHGRPAGPESSLVKLVWSEVQQHLAEIAGDVLGPEANTDHWGHERLYAPSFSIAGGTTQVNRNLVAQRVLGLPRA